MDYSFNTGAAAKYGVECAVILQNIAFWVKKNKANKRHLHKHTDGGEYYWTYNSAEAFSELFPFWSPKKISRLLLKLEADGAIASGVFNKMKLDRTKWYAILDWTDLGNTLDTSVQSLDRSVQPLPDVNADNEKTDRNIKNAGVGVHVDKAAAKKAETPNPQPPSPANSSQDVVKLPGQRGYDPKTAHTFSEKNTDHGCAVILATELLDGASKAYGKKLIGKSSVSAQHIIKLFKDGASALECHEVIKWLYTVNASSDYPFCVESGDSLRKKWDKVQMQMFRKPTTSSGLKCSEDL